MANLSNIQQIRHNKENIILIRFNRTTIYEKQDYYIEYTVDDYDFSLDQRFDDDDSFRYGLPRIYTDEKSYSYNYNNIEIMLLDGSITTDTSTRCNMIRKVKLWFPRTTYKVCIPDPVTFDNKSLCSGIETIDYCNTSNFRSMYCMFRISNLIAINTKSFDTGNVTNMSNMFYDCAELESLDLSNFNTDNVTDMSSMFQGCYKLATLDLSNLDTSEVTNMSYMFYNCESLTELDVSNFDTSNVTDMSNMFYGCDLLETLDLSSFDANNTTTLSGMFMNCTSLKNLQAPKNISSGFAVNNCPLTYESLMNIINNLATVTSTKTLLLGSANLAKLSGEERSIATKKGWTLV